MLTLILILLPALAALILLPVKKEETLRQAALAFSLAEFGVAVAALYRYLTSCHCNLLFSADWFPAAGATLRFGIDGISLWLVMLTAFLVPVILAASFRHGFGKSPAFYSLVFLMQTALMGVFTAGDGLLFYIFWELALIPAWFICALWGGRDRIRITFKFFLYTFTGSLFMLVALLWLYLRTPLPHSFAWPALVSVTLSPAEQMWIFGAFFLAFAIKIPLFPFHTWQPSTYSAAPAPGSMLLAGIMLKMGLYGLIRWLLPLSPLALPLLAPWAIGLAVTGIVYASVIAVRQDDMKRLVAWSSIAHVGLIAAGIFTLNPLALQGAVIQMVAHGVNITGLFLVIDLIEHRTGTRRLAELGGIARKAPRLAVVFMILLLGSVALPLTNGFPGEFLLLTGLFQYAPWVAAVAGLTVIFSAVYMLRMYQRAMLGEESDATAGFRDLTAAETVLFYPLAVMVIWMGVAPGFFLRPVIPEALQLLNFIQLH